MIVFSVPHFAFYRYSIVWGISPDQLYPEAVRSLAEEEDKTLTFYDFPQTMHRYIRTTNAIESLFSNVRQRTDQIDMFTTEMSCLTIVWATIEGITLRKVPVE